MLRNSPRKRLFYIGSTISINNNCFRFNVSDLLERPSLSIKNSVFTLKTRCARAERNPQITLSAAFRYIHRPKTSSFGVHQSLQDLHKIMTSPITASHSPAHRSSNCHTDDNEDDKLVKHKNGEEPTRNYDADGPKKSIQGKRIVTNGGLTYPRQRKSSRRSFGESLDLRHIDDSSSCGSSTITKDNTEAKQYDVNALRPKMGAETADSRSTSTPAFPEFTEKLSEASEFVKRNPVRRLNNTELSGGYATPLNLPTWPAFPHNVYSQLLQESEDSRIAFTRLQLKNMI